MKRLVGCHLESIVRPFTFFRCPTANTHAWCPTPDFVQSCRLALKRQEGLDRYECVFTAADTGAQVTVRATSVAFQSVSCPHPPGAEHMTGATCQLRVDGRLSTAGPHARYAPPRKQHAGPDPKTSQRSPQRAKNPPNVNGDAPQHYRMCGCLMLWNRVSQQSRPEANSAHYYYETAHCHAPT